MNLNVRRAKVKAKDGNIKNKFYVNDSHTADKIMKSQRLEEIRLSILQNLQFYHPEAGEQLAWGRKAKKQSARSPLEPLGMSHRSVPRLEGTVAAPYALWHLLMHCWLPRITCCLRWSALPLPELAMCSAGRRP